MVCFAGGLLFVDEPDLNCLTDWIASPIKARYTHPTKNRGRLQFLEGGLAAPVKKELPATPTRTVQHLIVGPRHVSKKQPHEHRFQLDA